MHTLYGFRATHHGPAEPSGECTRLPATPHLFEDASASAARAAFHALRARIDAEGGWLEVHSASLFTKHEVSSMRYALRRAGFRTCWRGAHWHSNGLRHPSLPGRRFRVLPHLDRMDICDGAFDRWANSGGASVHLPLSPAEATAALATLRAASAGRVASALAMLPPGAPPIALMWTLRFLTEAKTGVIVRLPVNHGGLATVETYDDPDWIDPSFETRLNAAEWRALKPHLRIIRPFRVWRERLGWWHVEPTQKARALVLDYARRCSEPTAHERAQVALIEAKAGAQAADLTTW